MQCRQNSQSKKIDPVCGMTVDPSKTNLVADFNGQQFFFCARPCLEAFNRQPHHYWRPAQTPVIKKKGLWGRYLERLNKATGGKSIRCH